MAHAATDFKLNGLGVGNCKVAFEMFDRLFGCNVALAIGLVDGDAVVVYLVADQHAYWAAGHLAKHIEDGKLDSGDWNPDGQPLSFVVTFVDSHRRYQLLDIARILSNKERGDALNEDGVQGIHLLRVRNGNAFMSVLRANTAEIFLLVSKQFYALNHDRIRKKAAIEYRLLQDGVQSGEALTKGSREPVAGRIEELGPCRIGENCGSRTARQSGGDEAAAIRLHGVISFLVLHRRSRPTGG